MNIGKKVKIFLQNNFVSGFKVTWRLDTKKNKKKKSKEEFVLEDDWKEWNLSMQDLYSICFTFFFLFLNEWNWLILQQPLYWILFLKITYILEFNKNGMNSDSLKTICLCEPSKQQFLDSSNSSNILMGFVKNENVQSMISFPSNKSPSFQTKESVREDLS